MAPYIQSKLSDPPVVVDVCGRYAISLLSGHEGDANELTLTVANILGDEPIITTTTEAAKNLIIGIGCRRDCPAAEIIEAVHLGLEGAGGPLEQVRFLTSADIKAHEAGLIAAARELSIPLRFIPSDEVRGCAKNLNPTPLAQKKVNLPAVAEPTALLAGVRGAPISLGQWITRRPQPSPVPTATLCCSPSGRAIWRTMFRWLGCAESS